MEVLTEIVLTSEQEEESGASQAQSSQDPASLSPPPGNPATPHVDSEGLPSSQEETVEALQAEEHPQAQLRSFQKG